MDLALLLVFKSSPLTLSWFRWNLLLGFVLDCLNMFPKCSFLFPAVLELRDHTYLHQIDPFCILTINYYHNYIIYFYSYSFICFTFSKLAAMFIATVDFPTPPLQLLTPIIFFTSASPPLLFSLFSTSFSLFASFISIFFIQSNPCNFY